MMSSSREITRADILPMEEYGKVRAAKRREAIEMKKPRRVPVGPDATFYFENYATMWAQVHEMLWIERGGEEQIADELSAYNPLIPQGRELVATLMFEIDDPVRREALLRKLTHVETMVSLRIGDMVVTAAPTDDDHVERTKADGKTSSIHFLRFAMTGEQVAAFRSGQGEVMLAISHPEYGHMAVLSPATRAALAGDLTADDA
ncbi:MAG: DUF3501 family protein [Alphaproteobacteria bacterium]